VALEVPSAELRMAWSLSMGVGPVGAVLAVRVELPDPLSVLSEATAVAPACRIECVRKSKALGCCAMLDCCYSCTYNVQSNGILAVAAIQHCAAICWRTVYCCTFADMVRQLAADAS